MKLHPSWEMEKKTLEELEDPKVSEVDIPDGGYGWLVVFGIFLLTTSTFGANASYSIFLAYYLEHSVFANATKIDYAAIGGISFGSGLVFSPVLVIVSQKIGIKCCMSIGAVLQGVGLLLAAFSKKLWQIYLTQGLLVGLGIGLLFVPSYGVIPQWFREKRSLALSLAACGAGAGGILYNLSIQAIIKSLGLKWAFIIETILVSSMCAVAIILFRTRDELVQPTTKVWDTEVMREPAFHLIAGMLFLAMQGYVVILYNLADFTKTLGYSSKQASIVSSMVAVGAIIGRPIVGRLSDRFGPVNTNVIVHLVTAIFCFAMWIPVRTYAGVIVFAIIQGSMIGSSWIVLGSVTARVVGLKRSITVLNMMWFFCGISTIIAPIIAIKLRGAAPDNQLYSTTQYRDPAIYCGSAFLGTSLCLLLLRGYLVARDAMALKDNSNADNGELHYHVGIKQMLNNVLKRSPTRKI